MPLDSAHSAALALDIIEDHFGDVVQVLAGGRGQFVWVLTRTQVINECSHSVHRAPFLIDLIVCTIQTTCKCLLERGVSTLLEIVRSTGDQDVMAI